MPTILILHGEIKGLPQLKKIFAKEVEKDYFLEEYSFGKKNPILQQISLIFFSLISLIHFNCRNKTATYYFLLYKYRSYVGLLRFIS